MTIVDSEWPILTEGDCTLRVLALADAADWYRGEDEEQRRWFEFPERLAAPFSEEVAGRARWIETVRQAWSDGGPVHHWGIWTSGARVLSGGIEVRVRPDGRANVSYIVFPPARRRGLATQALRMASGWAFATLGVGALVAIADELNVASIGVARAAGFTLEGRAEPWEYSESGVMQRYVLDRTRSGVG